MNLIKLKEFRKDDKKGEDDEVKERIVEKYSIIASIDRLKNRYYRKNMLDKITKDIKKKLLENNFLSLEEALFSEEPRIIQLHEYLRTDSNQYGKKAVVNYVTLETLPHGDDWEVWGTYEIGRHTMYVARNMPIAKVKHTKRHEEVHSFGFHDEILTDRLASNPLSYEIMSAAA